MRKKIIVCLFTVQALPLFLLAYSIVKEIPWLTLLIAVLIAAEIYAAYGFYSLRKYNRKMTVNPKDDIERNYDRLIVGNATAVPAVLDKAMRLVGYHSNWKTDSEIVKRYYSFVKRGGTIDLYIDSRNKRYFVSNTLDPFRYDLLHKVTLYENQINKSKYFLGLFMSALKFPLLRLMRGKRRAAEYAERNVALDELRAFCQERGLRINYYK